jgi:hypothetical protein
MSILEALRRHGLPGTARKALVLARRKSGYDRWRYRGAPHYANPTPAELESIERELAVLGVAVHDYAPSPASFKAFQAEDWFSAGYHGGIQGGVWDEKVLEHWIASERLGLMGYGPDDVFVDVAATTSPWVQRLRERKGLAAYAIDIDGVGPAYRHLPYYRKEDATQTTFPDASVRGASLHCAYEMFVGENDTRFLPEAARILTPGGKAVILPLYMHTHYCAYATAEYFGKGYSDPAEKEYIRLDCSGVPSSRKYDAAALKRRVLDPIIAMGMKFTCLRYATRTILAITSTVISSSKSNDELYSGQRTPPERQREAISAGVHRDRLDLLGRPLRQAVRGALLRPGRPPPCHRRDQWHGGAGCLHRGPGDRAGRRGDPAYLHHHFLH